MHMRILTVVKSQLEKLRMYEKDIVAVVIF